MPGLFQSKALARLRAEACPPSERSFKRPLGPLHLTTLGVGAISGTGVFVFTGVAAALYAGPAVPISMLLAGFACSFAALCYAEMASAVPVAGSAYTYAYATLGEVVAWIIGWGLILEYAMGAAPVWVGWSAPVVRFPPPLGIQIPPALPGPP